MTRSNFTGYSDSAVLTWVNNLLAKSKELVSACKFEEEHIAYNKEFSEAILLYNLADLVRIAKVTGQDYEYTRNLGESFRYEVSVRVGEVTFHTFTNVTEGEVDEIISD